MRRDPRPTALPGAVRPAARLVRRGPAAALSLLALVALSLTAGPAAARDAAPADGPLGSVSWRADLSVPSGDETNVSRADGALRLRDPHVRPASARSPRGQGTVLLPVHRLDRAVDRITPDVDVTLPAGSQVVVDVRGQDGLGRWTEWREASADDPAVLPRAVTRVQARIVLVAAADGAVPGIRALSLSAELDVDDAGPSVAAAASLTATVYATREGLVGGTTANGHVIVADDHFVALPSRRGLSPKGSGQYSVRVCGPARCETAPVWDVGPWNTRDDYWNPSSTRESFKDLPRGRPEAQAAYLEGYNGGLDGSGRRVLNPAGIDLADGTFHNVGLNDNGYVTVEYLWTAAGAATTSFPTWGTDVNIRQQATSASTRVAQLAGPTTVRVQCQVRGQLVQSNGYSNDAWSYLPDYGGYVSNIFIDNAAGWLPGVPNC
ncbi:hypothetical protein OG233_04310 [Streptomyces sp. NBC_01218]|uniref:hypothetical protein n=1 Tax=unclassified Streptomyces TaxID=2593676 RepID=UPI0023B9DE90|nr:MULTISPECIES: hypothetical protein [unclassified Streptomyces]WEH38801.1 hypothetical protein PZB77_04350 [Streptomyces sp. AM 2-1-1]WSQ50463.1 hypothetical protein OG233_04310 [Streptomyces sp. NBC_01218]